VSEIDVVVAIVSYKSAGLTVDCLRSVEAERASPGLRVRAVVVDNASGDGPAIAEAIAANGWSPWATLVVSERNGGFAYGNNVALQRAFAEGMPDYVHLVNPDTLLRKGAIEALVRFLESHPEAGIAGSSFENADGSVWPIAFRFPSMATEFASGLQWGPFSRNRIVAKQMTPVQQPIDWVAGASMMLRRKLLETIGGLDENYFLYYEETDLCFRAKAAGFTTWYVPESRVMHIGGQSTQVTVRNQEAKRLPAYWFESRRRFFTSSYGLSYALLTDVVAVVGNLLGIVKRTALMRGERGVPYYIRDLSRHSVFRAKNRQFPAPKCFKPLAGS
jgi:GT2 family glycosyltransferase